MAADERPPVLEPEFVNEFVLKAHGDFDTVKRLLEQEPELLNAAWDWGGGDWETGLGAAAHMGRRAIALHLLERGARMDVFAAAMLGETEVRKDAIGPLEMMDLGGLDLWREVLRNLCPRLHDSRAAEFVLSEKVEHGELGVRSGRGFYVE